MSVSQVRLLLMVVIVGLFSSGKSDPFVANEDPLIKGDLRTQQSWGDSVFNALTFDERLGQLFMVGLPGFVLDDSTRRLIEEFRISKP